MTEEKKTDFGFTSFTWHEVTGKIWLFSDVFDSVKNNFHIGDYSISPNVKILNFALEIEPEPVFFNQKSSYNSKKGIIQLYGKIPYDAFKAADDKTALHMMCESYLSAILLIPTLRGMKNKNFDAQGLHDDVKKAFFELGIKN